MRTSIGVKSSGPFLSVKLRKLDLKVPLRIVYTHHPTPETESNQHPNNVSERLDTFILASQKEVRKLVKELKTKSCELDPIPTWLLNSCLNELLPMLTKIFNTFLETAHVPQPLKSSRVRPLLKKPSLDQNTLKNYRPVSNLSHVSKLLEKVVNNRIEDNLEKQFTRSEPIGIQEVSLDRNCHVKSAK